MANHCPNNTRQRVNALNTGARNHLAVAAVFRSGAGAHKPPGRGGDRNETRDLLEEYYSEYYSPDDDS